MAEALLLGLALAVAGVAVLGSLWHPAEPLDPDSEREAAETRHRVALEALRDLDADRRAGLLDDDAYAAQLAEAEARAAATRAALDAPPRPRPTSGDLSSGRRSALGVAAVVGVALVAGSLLPGTGIANGIVVNRALADAQATEQARQDRIESLRAALGDDPDDAEVVSQLADAHLAGSSADDLARAAAALQLLIALEPDRADAYERIVAAYLRAGDHANARAALDAYAQRPTADEVEVAFFDGLIALRGEKDPDRAGAAFDRFLELAPDDPRAEMVRGLRQEAAAGG